MTTDVLMGRTKSPAGTSLVPMSLGDKKEERVILLLHVEGKTGGKDTLEDEAKIVLQHAVLDGEGDAYSRLEGGLKELNGLIKGLLLSGSIRDVHAIVGLLEKDGMLHLSHAGRAEAYLVRDGSAAQITEYSRGKPTPSFVHIASGPLAGRDHVILSSQRLLRTMTPAQLAQISQRGGNIIKDIVGILENEKETACLAYLAVEGEAQASFLDRKEAPSRRLAGRRGSKSRGGSLLASLTSFAKHVPLPSVSSVSLSRKSPRGKQVKENVQRKVSGFLSDLRDPKRKRRAHLFLLAGAAGLFLVFWVVIQLSLATQKNQSRQELAALMEQINADLRTAENRQLTGDSESANAILQRAEDRARQVMNNESGLYRGEALDLLDTIRSKFEEINNIVRIAPRLVVNLGSKNPDIVAQGLLGIGEGEFTVYDKQDLYRVLLNTVEDADRLDDEELILDAVSFPRYQTRVFLTTSNSIIELINGQPTNMKTEDSAGWVTGQDIKTYLRYLYVLLPDRNQIYKYERLSNRYGSPSEYNVNGDVKNAIDMAINGSIYILNNDGSVTKLFRGEERPFTIRNLPEGALDGAKKIMLSEQSGNIYFLIPDESRVVVATGDGDLGESSYLRQYVLEGEQVGAIKDFFVDAEELRLYVLDEKRLHAIDLQGM